MIYDVCVIGGGASGLAAAIAAGREGASVLVIERMDKTGKKILATGNGKCNLTNQAIRRGCISSGAPVEMMPYEEVEYWDELCRIMDWTTTHVHSTMHVCWGAFAGLYYHYGIKKFDLDKKLFGIFPHQILKKTSPLFRGFNDEFLAPHSRATDVNVSDVAAVPELEIMALTKEGSLAIAKTKDSRQFFVTCHAEYDANTLALEYNRDMEKGLTSVDLPINYFPDDDPTKAPVVTWRSTGQLLYSNWLNFYVYQSTPYDIKDIK